MSYMLPLNAFVHVLLLFLLQDNLNEQLLQLLIAVVDAELLETERQTRNLFNSNNNYNNT